MNFDHPFWGYVYSPVKNKQPAKPFRKNPENKRYANEFQLKALTDHLGRGSRVE
jgi:uncharacterized membrane protein YkgB